ncbi:MULTISPECIES: hypothetical protein [unclassified Streptomyces]|uniref:hypothetical protein n=1 Tax=unclassified Streptomyces TaxID=2593676 RepID=UPI00136E6402|nr:MULTISPECIES: hypothetical protein [unclassified Streptomyces]NEA02698.1 hypothetical protein [Streptomyces sp. SID10116]MYY84747.1 hypothetical protein [Streptomyces sp. SID335]MYZ12663.1 hypothetical protein [Streptomyces sp. SID337]NDZ87150.1 hypothetical protein [Streptomyces sp. SID10115]NEB47690.1 hypothetical protein [Streptomyces sp. SID339]
MTRDQDPARLGADVEAHGDIAHRLADVADEVEIGAAPYQAVLRGGRRRKARRWALGALAAATIVASTGSLALAVVDGRDRTQTASERGTAQDRHVYTPWYTPLTEVRDGSGNRSARVELQVWGAPRGEREAHGQKVAMMAAGVWDERKTDPVPDFDRPWYAIVVTADGKEKVTSFGLQDEEPGGDDGLGFASVEFEAKGRTVTVGHVGPRTKRVEYEYEDGTSEPELHRAAGSAYLWFTRQEGEPGPSGELVSIRLYGEDKVVTTVQED